VFFTPIACALATFPDIFIHEPDNDHLIQGHQNLDSLFGPASPPSFLDAEQLMSPTGRNIWGSPHHETTYQTPTRINNIQAMFDIAKSANSVSPLILKSS